MLPDTVEAVSVVLRDTKNNITYIISKIKVILTKISLCLQYSMGQDGAWVKGLVGHMGHESLSLTHLQLCLQVCQIRRNRIGQNNGLVNLHWLDYCFVLFYFTLLLIYGCRVVYYVCMSPLMCLYSCIIDSQKGAIGKFSLYYLLGVQQNLIFSESTPLGQAEPSVVMAALWIASASMFSKITDCTQ